MVVYMPHGASTITATLWQWLLKSEERDNRATFGLIHHRISGDGNTFALVAALSR